MYSEDVDKHVYFESKRIPMTHSATEQPFEILTNTRCHTLANKKANFTTLDFQRLRRIAETKTRHVHCAVYANTRQFSGSEPYDVHSPTKIACLGRCAMAWFAVRNPRYVCNTSPRCSMNGTLFGWIGTVVSPELSENILKNPTRTQSLCGF